MTLPITAVEWRIGDPPRPEQSREVRIVERINRDGARRFAVVEAGWVLNKDGEWEYEPLPSSRDDAFMERCRFDEFDDAYYTFERTGGRW